MGIYIEMEVGLRTYGVTNIRTFSWGEGAKLKIGNFCSIASNCNIYLGGNHQVGWYTTYPFGHVNKDVFHHHGRGHPTTKGDVIIGNDVWIGANVTIMSGVSIGHGAIVANNSHVVKSVAPYTIVGGNPANVIRKRFSEDEIEFLLDLEWWNMPELLIDKIAPILCSGVSVENNQTIKEIVNQYYISLKSSETMIPGDQTIASSLSSLDESLPSLVLGSDETLSSLVLGSDETVPLENGNDFAPRI